MYIKLDPKSYIAYCSKGAALGQLGDYKLAIICNNIAISLNPQCYDAINNKSLALAQCEESLSTFAKLAVNHESTQMFLCNKASSLFKFKRYSEAIVYFDKSMSIKHGTALYKFALFQKTEALLLTDRFKEALKCSEELLEFEPNNASNLFNKGKALQQLKRYDESLEVFEQALKIDPNHVHVLGYAGFCLMKLEKWYESVKYCERCIELIDEKDESKSGLLNLVQDSLLISLNCGRIAHEIKEKADDFYQILLKFDIN